MSDIQFRESERAQSSRENHRKDLLKYIFQTKNLLKTHLMREIDLLIIRANKERKPTKRITTERVKV